MSDSCADFAAQDSPAARRARRLWLVMAVMACVLLRIWLIDHAEIIEPDGVVYFNAAKAFRADRGQMMTDWDIHPGYPAAIGVTDRLFSVMGLPDVPVRMEAAGRYVSLIASVLAMLALGWLATMAVNRRVALITVLLFGLTRKWAALGASVLTDATTACLAMWTFALALHVGRGLARDRPWALPASTAVGALAGATFLVRPEGMFVIIPPMVVWIAHAIARRRSWPRAVASCAAALIVMALLMAVYVSRIGVLTKRWPLPEFLGGGKNMLACVLAQTGWAVWQVLPKLSERLHPILAVTFGIWVLTWAVSRTRTRLPDAIKIFPKWDVVLLGATWFLVFTPVVIARNVRLGEMSGRYVLLHAMLLAPLAAAGAEIMGRWGAIFLSKLRVGAQMANRIMVPVAVVALAAALAGHAARPMHAGDAPLKDAGLWLYKRDVGAFVFVRTRQVLIYAGTPDTHGRALVNEAFDSRRTLLEALRDPCKTVTPTTVYAVWSDADIAAVNPKAPSWLTKPVFTRQAFSADGVRIYKIDMAALRKELDTSQKTPANATP